MAFDRFLIAPINSGLQTDVKSWLIPEDAFEYLQNAYVFRGRVRKRYGSLLMGNTQLQSRFRINLGNTPGPLNLPGNATQLQIGQMFSVGSDIFQVYQLGAGVTTLSTNNAITCTIDSTSNPNIVTFVGAPAATAVYYYPANPVMGLTQYLIGAVNDHPSYGFDTQFAYRFVPGSGWERSGTAIWKGTDLNYFWANNWTSIAGDTAMFVSNFNATTGALAPAATDDPIWYTTDGNTWVAALGGTANGFYFLPNGGAPQTGPFIQTARIIVPFKNRLVLLNTIENDNAAGAGVGNATQFANRARWCFYGSPLAVNAWYEPNQRDSAGNIAQGGNYADAATDEQIISAEFIKDHLIVYFERSTWELVYTGNQIQPFYWQKINTELGSQSTFSTIPFDREVLTIGNTGVHSCTGTNVQRIDSKIPDQIFEFETRNNGVLRTVGIRDYFTELALWAFSSVDLEPNQKFPNQMLIFNYRNGSWAKFDDCFTFFGYFEQQESQLWATSFNTWQQSSESWNSGLIQANQRQIIAGTPEGFVLRLAPDVTRNAPSMSITNITGSGSVFTLTIINHNLSATPEEFPSDMDYILIENVIGNAETEFALNGSIFRVESTPTANTITITVLGINTLSYLGGGTATRVSNIQIKSKRFNPYVSSDRNFYLAKVDFGVKKTDSGEITVDYFTSSAPVSMLQGGVQTGAIMGNGVLTTSPYALYPLELYQDLLWHPVYFQSSGQYIQLAMYFSDAQMRLNACSLGDFELEGMVLYTQPTSQRLQ